MKKFKTIAIVVIVLSGALWNFSQLEGRENIRNIHIVSLVVIGMCIGVLLANIMEMFSKKN
jgi:uncharacterized membrane protein